MSETVISELATSPLSQEDGSKNRSLGRISENDSRSSSLSELEFGTEERNGTPSRDYNDTASDSHDSEAETEKLENTPHKSAGSGTITALNDIDRIHSPSKLSSRLPIETSSPDGDSPDMGISRTATNSTTINGNGSIRDTSQPPSGLSDDGNGDSRIRRKRKRSAEIISHTDVSGTQEAELTQRRNISTRATALSAPSRSESEAVNNDSETGKDTADHLGQTHINIPDEALDNECADEYGKLKLARIKKGKRKGKQRPADSLQEVDEEAPLNSDIVDEATLANDVAVADTEEGESTINNEESQVKDAALNSLGAVEAQFAEFRSKLFDDRIAQLSYELQLLKQPNCMHPEYLAQLRCVDERRKERLHYENTLFRYKQKALGVRRRAEHSQLHSQYFQEVREIRDKALERCGKFLYDIQKGRRRWGASESDYTQMYQPRRSRQLQQQGAYNLEVSILSGVAKYVGFPAAPEMKGANQSEVDEDFRAMRMTSHPNIPVTYTKSDAVRLAQASAEERFLEQTPWANPQHPAHNRIHVRSNAQTPHFANNPFIIPAAQQRRADTSGVANGSVTTAEVAPNSFSAATAPVIPTSASIDHTQSGEFNRSPTGQATNGIFKTSTNRHITTIKQDSSIPQLSESAEARKVFSKTSLLQRNAGQESGKDISDAVQPVFDGIKYSSESRPKPFSSPHDARHHLPLKRDGTGEGEVPSPSMQMKAGLPGMAVEAKVR